MRIDWDTGKYLLSYVSPSALLGSLFKNGKSVARLTIIREPSDSRKRARKEQHQFEHSPVLGLITVRVEQIFCDVVPIRHRLFEDFIEEIQCSIRIGVIRIT